MIELRKLKELVKLMKDNDLTELDLHDDGERVTLKRASPAGPVMTVPAAMAAPAHVPAASAAVQAEEKAAAPALPTINSPMVGTYYSAPSPDAGDFVSVGDRVNKDTVVCIIEAMKVFNEIKAETSGVVERILIAKGDTVEYGQALFEIRPA